MTVVICDDNPGFAQKLRGYIQRWTYDHHYDGSIIIKVFSSSEDLLECWAKGMETDLLFLDIQIPGEISGLELAKTIRQKNSYINIVFVTNYAEYACDGYNVNALRYLKKPVTDAQVAECMDITYKQWYYAQGSYSFLFRSKNSMIIPYQHIIYFEAYGHYITVHAIEREPFSVRGVMKEIQSRIPPETFIQCHKSFIVNLQFVRGFCSDSITMANKAVIPIGKKFADSFFNALQCYFQGMRNEE